MHLFLCVQKCYLDGGGKKKKKFVTEFSKCELTLKKKKLHLEQFQQANITVYFNKKAALHWI